MMIPACFSQPNTPSTSRSITQTPHNLVTCTYQTQLCNSQTYLTLSWFKSSVSHTLTLYAPHCFTFTITLKPSTFSFLRTKPGSKSIYLTRAHKKTQKLKLNWDFSKAEFNTQNSAEPESCFYLAIYCNRKIEFFLGDPLKQFENHEPFEQNLLSRREHVFGSKSYVSKGEFMGSKHEIQIEHCDGNVLRVKVDGKVRLVIKRLSWKFRGNERFFIDGVEVEFYWDVLSWVVNGDGGNGNGNCHGVFVFQVGDGGAVWPEMVGPEKRFMKKSFLGSNMSPSMMAMSPSASSSGVMRWAEESSDGGRSSCSSTSTKSCGSNGGFSLLLYAWTRD